ncbi:Scaffold domain-containing protein [Acanthopleuribacter pedis]|uniref:L,D-transpeptidase scaffold domain-containing protein n=1 Tax=Acanthopleuribacter pedis TaxID=442870 RepID=A0A8J7QHH8_9BACT|nr:hypothetical protein [Acanthopleuribacter pedis]
MIGFILLMGTHFLAIPSPGPNQQQASELIRRVVEQVAVGEPVTMKGETLHSTVLLPRLYRDHGFMPLWFLDNKPRAALLSLPNTLDQAEAHGLTGKPYHRARLRRLFEQQ